MRSRGSLLVRAVCVALAVTMGAAAPAVADGADDRGESVVAEGGGASVEITGLGYGHGTGLSQYGAKGRGEAGHGYRRIVEHYYPGTRWGRAGGRVRVLITADDTRDVVVVWHPGLSVTALRAGRTWTPKQQAGRWRIDSAAGGRSVISYRTRRWHEWRTVRGEAQFSSRRGPLTLVTPDGKVAFRGALRSATPDGGGRDRDTVNVVRLDAYLRGVVPSEVVASAWPQATLRAQSVAARTYAAHERAAAPAGRHYQICDTAHCQVYGGVAAEYPTTDDAIRETAGEVMVRAGEPIFAQFSASNGGHSVAGDFDYLRAEPDRFDTFNPDGGPVGWDLEVDSTDITRHWRTDIGDFESITVDTRDGNGEWGGRAVDVLIKGSEGSIPTNGDALRRFLGLRSDFFCFPQFDVEC